MKNGLFEAIGGLRNLQLLELILYKVNLELSDIETLSKSLMGLNKLTVLRLNIAR